MFTTLHQTLPVPAWIADLVQQLMTYHQDAEVRIIGGWVRDQWYGQSPSELDLATTLLPEEVIAALADVPNVKIVPTGMAFGTVMLVTPFGSAEITTLRRDIACDGRYATVVYTKDWHADALRRDFTINALSYSFDGIIHDYVGGLEDLAARKVHFIGQAAERIEEDYLRILRFLRFSSWLSQTLDDKGAKACLEAVASLQHLSVERIQMEFNKWLIKPIPEAIICHHACKAVLNQCIGGPIHTARYLAFAPWLSYVAPHLRVLCSLWMLKEDMNMAHLLEHLRFPNALQRHSRMLAELWPRLQTYRHLRRLAEELVLENERDLGITSLVIGHVLQGSTSSLMADLTYISSWDPPLFPLNGKDLLAAGMQAGPGIKEALTIAKHAWIDSNYRLNKQALLKQVISEKK